MDETFFIHKSTKYNIEKAENIKIVIEEFVSNYEKLNLQLSIEEKDKLSRRILSLLLKAYDKGFEVGINKP